MITLKAKKMSLAAHEGQMYGTYPYSVHLKGVYDTLVTFGILNEVILAVAWLHDTIEDTSVLYEDIYDSLGYIIADLTYLVTDKRGRNRAERHRATYPDLALDHFARLVKLADRISNVTTTMHDKQELFAKYLKEYGYFKETLQSGIKPESDEYHEIEMKMWSHLDHLLSLGPFVEG